MTEPQTNGDWNANRKLVLKALKDDAANIKALYEKVDTVKEKVNVMVGMSIGVNIVVGIVVVLAVAYLQGRGG